MTGFKPYSVFKRNPSGEIAQLLDGSYFKGNEVVGLSLDVSHSYLRTQYPEVLKNGYDVIINTSLSPGNSSIDIVRVAVNWQDEISDVDGVSPKSGKIVSRGPEGIISRLPIDDIIHALRSARIPSKISLDSGSFISNKIFYYSLYLTKVRTGLIQLPMDSESSLDGKFPTMNIDNMIRSVEVSIQKTI